MSSKSEIKTSKAHLLFSLNIKLSALTKVKSVTKSMPSSVVKFFQDIDEYSDFI